MRFQDLVEHEVGHVVDLTHSSNFKNFSGDFLAKIVQNTHFDTRLPAPEGKSGAPCLAAFSISAGRAFVNLLNQVVQRAHLGDFEPQPRVKVGFLSSLNIFAEKLLRYRTHSFVACWLHTPTSKCKMSRKKCSYKGRQYL